MGERKGPREGGGGREGRASERAREPERGNSELELERERHKNNLQ